MHACMHQMETRSSKKRHLLIEADNLSKRNIWTNFGQDDGSDRISNLPDELLHQILTLLPINQIAQTSILSKRWRSLWASLPDLDFTSLTLTHRPRKAKISHGIQSEVSNTSMPVFDDINPISNVLGYRNKSRILRRLRFSARLSFSMLNDLIRSAVRKNVQELDIEVVTHGHFSLPRCVLRSESLKVFKLKSWYPGFRLPPSSIVTNGFKSLHQLSLSMVVFGKHCSLHDMFVDGCFPLLKKLRLEYCFGLEHVVFGCRSLEELHLQNCFELRSLEISCGKLETLKVRSCLDAYNEDRNLVHVYGSKIEILEWEYNSFAGIMSFENLNSLEFASVAVENISTSNISSVSKLLEIVKDVTFLSLDCPCFEVMVSSGTPMIIFNDLKSLELRTGFRRICADNLSYILSKSPFVENLTILVNAFEPRIKRFWEMLHHVEDSYWDNNQAEILESFLQHLKVLKIYGFGLCKGEVSFLNFLIKHARNLATMVFVYEERDLELRDNVRTYFKDLCARVPTALPRIVFELSG